MKVRKSRETEEIARRSSPKVASGCEKRSILLCRGLFRLLPFETAFYPRITRIDTKKPEIVGSIREQTKLIESDAYGPTSGGVLLAAIRPAKEGRVGEAVYPLNARSLGRKVEKELVSEQALRNSNPFNLDRLNGNRFPRYG